ncbi:hypothetical protein Sjap_018924 [Stephania japonica]|uniref:Uncharacterized protein n=1 Tax=Stephania japonica TaxID=461633 RepID=A0AAP0I8Y2_9MAGN
MSVDGGLYKLIHQLFFLHFSLLSYLNEKHNVGVEFREFLTWIDVDGSTNYVF